MYYTVYVAQKYAHAFTEEHRALENLTVLELDPKHEIVDDETNIKADRQLKVELERRLRAEMRRFL